jgi:hypothetical protein
MVHHLERRRDTFAGVTVVESAGDVASVAEVGMVDELRAVVYAHRFETLGVALSLAALFFASMFYAEWTRTVVAATKYVHLFRSYCADGLANMDMSACKDADEWLLQGAAMHALVAVGARVWAWVPGHALIGGCLDSGLPGCASMLWVALSVLPDVLMSPAVLKATGSMVLLAGAARTAWAWLRCEGKNKVE